MNSIITNNKSEIEKICKQHKIKKLYAFGSVCTDKFNEKSDVDLIVYVSEENPVEKGELLLNIWDKFENLFKRKVDLLTDQIIENQIFKNIIENSKILIYGREN